MPQTSFDQSDGKQFVTSGARARNEATVGFDLFQTINISRYRRWDNNAFFNAFVHCNALDFSVVPLIPDPPVLPLPGIRRSHYYMDSDVAPANLYAPPSGQPPYPLGTVIIDTNPASTVETPNNNPAFYSIWLSKAIAQGTFTGIQACIPGSFDALWPAGYPFSVGAWFALSCFSAESWSFENPTSQLYKYFASQKSRFRLTAPRIGFTAIATLTYDEDRFSGAPVDIARNVNGITNVRLESTTTFAAGVWHHIGLTGFNTDDFRFVILNETPAQWSARTGIPFV